MFLKLAEVSTFLDMPGLGELVELSQHEAGLGSEDENKSPKSIRGHIYACRGPHSAVPCSFMSSWWKNLNVTGGTVAIAATSSQPSQLLPQSMVITTSGSSEVCMIEHPGMRC